MSKGLRGAGRIGLMLFLGVSFGGARVEGGWVWTRETGWYNPRSAVQSTAAELYTEAQKAYQAKHYRDAATGFQILLTTYPNSAEAKKAHLLLLEAQYLSEDFGGALDTIDAILRGNPGAETISSVVKRRYDIGYAYLNGAHRFFLGIPMSGENRGVEILQGIADHYPFQPFSDDALFHLAGNYFKNQEYERAEAVYERLIKLYDASEWVGIAEYQIGETAFRRVKGVEYDFSLVDKAQESFRRYLLRHPNGNKREDAQKRLKEIDNLRAQKLLGIAKFYLRDQRPESARYYLLRIRTDHPEAPPAKEAWQLLNAWRLLKPAGAPGAS